MHSGRYLLNSPCSLGLSYRSKAHGRPPAVRARPSREEPATDQVVDRRIRQPRHAKRHRRSGRPATAHDPEDRIRFDLERPGPRLPVPRPDVKVLDRGADVLCACVGHLSRADSISDPSEDPLSRSSAAPGLESLVEGIPQVTRLDLQSRRLHAEDQGICASNGTHLVGGGSGPIARKPNRR